MASKTLSLAIVLAAVFVTLPANAQDYLGDNAILIANRETRTSKTKLLRDTKPEAAWAMVFRSNIWEPKDKLEDLIIDYEELPNCTESKVQLDEVYNHTQGSDAFDVLFYSKDDPSQNARAQSYKGQAVPYEAALVVDPQTRQPNSIQEFARMVQIKCLPTRFHFTYIGSKRYIEYRLGDRAWD